MGELDPPSILNNAANREVGYTSKKLLGAKLYLDCGQNLFVTRNDKAIVIYNKNKIYRVTR